MNAQLVTDIAGDGDAPVGPATRLRPGVLKRLRGSGSGRRFSGKSTGSRSWGRLSTGMKSTLWRAEEDLLQRIDELT